MHRTLALPLVTVLVLVAAMVLAMIQMTAKL